MTTDPGVPIIPVLQGWSLPDYLRHIELYAAAGIDLAAIPLVGVGSVCRRQGTTGAAVILRTVAARGIRSHAFGLKLGGLLRSAAAVGRGRGVGGLARMELRREAMSAAPGVPWNPRPLQ